MQSERRLGENSMLELALILSDLVADLGYWLIFIFSLRDNLSIYFNQFLPIIINTFWENLLISDTNTAELIHSKIRFS